MAKSKPRIGTDSERELRDILHDIRRGGASDVTFGEMLGKVDITGVVGQSVELINIIEERTGVRITDSKITSVARAISAHAFINGRMTAISSDLVALRYILPETKDQEIAVDKVLRSKLGRTVPLRD